MCASCVQADVKEILPHTALLFSLPAPRVAPLNSLVPDAAQGFARLQAADAAEAISGNTLDRQAAEIAALLDSLATSTATKLRQRSERELDLLAAAFDYQPQQKILAREVLSRSLQVQSLPAPSSTDLALLCAGFGSSRVVIVPLDC
jgi:hypothetical protein